MIGLAQTIVVLVAAQRLAELALARRNTRRLLAQGGRETGRGHYPLFVLLHGAWLGALFIATPADTPPDWLLISLFTGLQLGRIWVIASLGPWWTTRVISVPDAPLVRKGPYRWVRHPNYLIVAGEIVVLPLAFGQTAMAVLFCVLNGLLTLHRIRIEDQALAGRRARPAHRPVKP